MNQTRFYIMSHNSPVNLLCFVIMISFYVSGDGVVWAHNRFNYFSESREKTRLLSTVLWVKNSRIRLWTSFLRNEIFQFLFLYKQTSFFNRFLRYWKEIKLYDNYIIGHNCHKINRYLIFWLKLWYSWMNWKNLIFAEKK